MMKAELRETFAKADLDKDGFLTKDEIRKALVEDDPSYAFTEEQIDDVWKQLDLNEDGKVSCQGNIIIVVLHEVTYESLNFTEFIGAMVTKFDEESDEESDEQNSTMEAELREAFAKADLDKDGFLTKDEIRKALVEDDPSYAFTEEQIDDVWKQLDLNEDGKVSCQGT